jgi:hypothetical protein
MTFPADALERTGYRLPTEAECCWAIGSFTSRIVRKAIDGMLEGAATV